MDPSAAEPPAWLSGIRSDEASAAWLDEFRVFCVLAGYVSYFRNDCGPDGSFPAR